MVPGDELRDTAIGGFGARCRTAGECHFFLHYRSTGGRQRWLTLGRHGDLTVAEARRMAQSAKQAVREGEDPQAERARKRQEGTIADLADAYLAQHVAAHNKASSAGEFKRLVENRIKPRLGAIKAGELSRGDVKRWHHEMRATPYEANRSLSCLSKIMAIAAADELRPDNPCKAVQRFPETARERFFSGDELRRLGAALAAIDENASEPAAFTLAVRILATTGMRLGEVLTLRWAYVDLPHLAFRLPDAKAGARTVSIGAPTAALIDGLEHREGFVISTDGGATALDGNRFHKSWHRLRQRAKLENARPHDLRHSFATHGAIAGASALALREMLGHKTLAMTGRYIARATALSAPIVESLSATISAAMDTTTSPAVVRVIKRGT